MPTSFFKNLIFLGAIPFLTSCATPLTGFIYTDIQYAKTVTSNQAGNRTGEACASSILGAVATGDMSIETARRNGGITLMTSVDQTAFSVLGPAYTKMCTVVRGR